MPRAAVKLSPAMEEPPAWWAEQFAVRQQRARVLAIRILRKAGCPLSSGEFLNYTGTYSRREFLYAVEALVVSGEIRRFVRHEPFTTAFKVSLGCQSKMVDRTYYELTEQP